MELACLDAGMAEYRLRGWYTVRRRNRRGELREHLSGQVFGHERWADGSRITTTAIVRRDGARAWTASGSTYRLEDEVGVERLGQGSV